ncbi:MAG: hypothetical protein J6V14_02050 [Clostridia bacterium]|nr:hypothetical protein [Clostridia bacterium]
MKRFWSKADIKLKAIIIALLIAILNVTAVYVFGLAKADIEAAYISPLAFALSTAAVAAHIAFCISFRIMKCPEPLLGVFFYQMFCVACYVLFFVGFVGSEGKDSWFTGFFTVFRWWTVGYQDFLVMIARFTGIPFRFSGPVIYLILTLITGRAYISVRKDIKYEETVQKEKAYYSARV